MSDVITTSRSSSRGRLLATVIIAVVAFVGTMTIGSAAFAGERVQHAKGTGGNGNVTAEFDSQPTQGHALVAISSHRVDWESAEMENFGWQKLFAHVDSDDDDHGGSRRGLAMWVRIAGQNEPTEVEVQWDDGSETDRDAALLIQEFSGNYQFDTWASNTSGDDSVTELSTGTTDMAFAGAEESLVIGAYTQRGWGDEATWTDGLGDNLRLDSDQVDGANDPQFTLQSGYRTSTQQREWESTATWGANEEEALAGIAVFSETDWSFDDACAAEETHEVEVDDMAAYLMLDRSGSMEDLGTDFCCEGGDPDIPDDRCEGLDYYDYELDEDSCGYCCGDSLWEVAEGAINSAMLSLYEDLWFGIGYFASSSAWTEVDADEDSWEDVEESLQGQSPSGGTPSHLGQEEIRDTATMNYDDVQSGAIFITDGIPDDRQAAIEEACHNRDEEGLLQYVVGLGGATDQDFNDLHAAASGTGTCYYMGDEYDPCDDPGDPVIDIADPDSYCEGSHQAYNEDEFRDVLLSISAEMSCTFDVSSEGWEDGIDNPDSVEVEVYGAYGTEEVPHTDDAGTVDADACSGDDNCHGGYCRPPEDVNACNSNDDCPSDMFCHEHLGCTDEDDHCSEGCGSGQFCWFDKCVDDDEQCSAHDDCDTNEACHDGRCRNQDGDIDGDFDAWCPHDEWEADDWECEDSNEWCHEKVGCVEAAQCNDDTDCASDEFCWYGGCLDETDDQCDMTEGGWDFTAGGEQVVFDDDWCERIHDPDDIDEVTTRRACSCIDPETGAQPGDVCPIGNPTAPGCPAGNQVCIDGELECRPGDDGANTYPPPGDEDCPFECPSSLDGEACNPNCEFSWTYDPDNPQLVVFCDDDEELPEFLEGSRCDAGFGTFYCVQGQHMMEGECQEGGDHALRPMPEICDGLDNSCDGEIDNITESWEKFRNQEGPWDPDNEDYDVWTEEDQQQFEDAGFEEMYGDDLEDWVDGDFYEAAACFEEPFCVSHMCDDMAHHGPDDPNASYEEEFEAYMQGYTGGFEGCQCSPD